MVPDIETYLPYFDEFDLTHEQKVEYIEFLFNAMQLFVDRAFDPSASSPGVISDELMQAFEASFAADTE